MAALDIRHLAAPFTSKVNLITLIFIVILFAVYRLSMGALQTKEIKQSEKKSIEKIVTSSSSTEKSLTTSPSVEVQNNQPTAPFQDTSSGKDLVSELLSIPAKPTTENKAVEEKKAQPLSDIEKALGISEEEVPQ